MVETFQNLLTACEEAENNLQSTVKDCIATKTPVAPQLLVLMGILTVVTPALTNAVLFAEKYERGENAEASA